jgi:pyruvate dehydrogenase E2 component (dihydrolipoamide acetyltransferase)
MTKEIKIPEIGENIVSGTVVRLLVSEGQTVEADQPILEVETDKALVEIPAPAAGTIVELLVASGEEVKIGQVIGTLDSEAVQEGEAKSDPESAAKPESEPPAPEPEPESESEPPAPEPEPESEPSEPSAPKPESKSAAPPEPEPESKSAAPPKPESESKPKPESKSAAAAAMTARDEEEVVPAAPSVRRLARELGADLQGLGGSGPGGRITAEDVKAHVKQAMQAPGSPGRGAFPLPDFGRWGSIRREPLGRVRQTIAANTHNAWSTIPHVTQFDRADVTALQEFQQRHERTAERAGGKLTVTAILLKIVALGLRRFPRFNASIDPDAAEVILKEYVHIGLAVDTEHGLMVPVLRDADRKSILDLSIEIKALADKARARKLALEEFEGGTFTVSNQGGIGGTNFTPVVFWPQVAILGVSRTQIEPRFTEGAFVPRPILPLSLSYDHRLLDGADAARFLRWLAEAIEQPLLTHFESV